MGVIGKVGGPTKCSFYIKYPVKVQRSEINSKQACGLVDKCKQTGGRFDQAERAHGLKKLVNTLVIKRLITLFACRFLTILKQNDYVKHCRKCKKNYC